MKVATVEVDGLIIDEETGEILERPEGWTQTQDFRNFAQRRDEAVRQRDRWDKLAGFYGERLGEMLTALGTKKHVEADMSVQWVERKPMRKIDPAALFDVLAGMEMPMDERVRFLRECVKVVDADKALALNEDAVWPLVEYVPVKPYIRQDIVAKPAPAIRYDKEQEVTKSE